MFVVLDGILSLLSFGVCCDFIVHSVLYLVWFAFSLFVCYWCFFLLLHLNALPIHWIWNLFIFNINHTFDDCPLLKDVKLVEAYNTIFNDSNFESSCSIFRKTNYNFLRRSSIISIKIQIILWIPHTKINSFQFAYKLWLRTKLYRIALFIPLLLNRYVIRLAVDW